MDPWIKLYDSCVSILRRTLGGIAQRMSAFKYVDSSNLLASKKAAELFIDPSLDLRRVAKFYQQNLDKSLGQNNANDCMLQSLDDRNQFLDIHSKITQLFGKNIRNRSYKYKT